MNTLMTLGMRGVRSQHGFKGGSDEEYEWPEDSDSQ